VLPASPFISLLLVIDGCGTVEELHPSISTSPAFSRRAGALFAPPPVVGEEGNSPESPSARQGGSPLARRFVSPPKSPPPNGSGLVHPLHSGSVFMACAGTAVKLRAARGQKLLLFRATERHEYEPV
jgi:hypothetical protein